MGVFLDCFSLPFVVAGVIVTSAAAAAWLSLFPCCAPAARWLERCCAPQRGYQQLLMALFLTTFAVGWNMAVCTQLLPLALGTNTVPARSVYSLGCALRAMSLCRRDVLRELHGQQRRDGWCAVRGHRGRQPLRRGAHPRLLTLRRKLLVLTRANRALRRGATAATTP